MEGDRSPTNDSEESKRRHPEGDLQDHDQGFLPLRDAFDLLEG